MTFWVSVLISAITTRSGLAEIVVPSGFYISWLCILATATVTRSHSRRDIARLALEN